MPNIQAKGDASLAAVNRTFAQVGQNALDHRL